MTINPRSRPQQSIQFARRVVTGPAAACALNLDGAVRCWASGTFEGFAGDGCEMPLHQPRLIHGTWRTVSVGHAHVCGVMLDGAVACWGNCFNLECPGTFGWILEPTRWRSPEAAADVWCGDRRTCVAHGHTVTCWGNLLDVEPRSGVRGRDILLPGLVTHVVGGDGFQCALVAQRVYCWGAVPDGWGRHNLRERDAEPERLLALQEVYPTPVVRLWAAGRMLCIQPTVNSVCCTGRVAGCDEQIHECWDRSAAVAVDSRAVCVLRGDGQATCVQCSSEGANVAAAIQGAWARGMDDVTTGMSEQACGWRRDDALSCIDADSPSASTGAPPVDRPTVRETPISPTAGELACAPVSVTIRSRIAARIQLRCERSEYNIDVSPSQPTQVMIRGRRCSVRADGRQRLDVAVSAMGGPVDCDFAEQLICYPRGR